MLVKSPTLPTAMGARWQSWLGCQLGTVDAIGEMHKLDACKRAMQTVTWTDARVRLDIPHIPLKLGGAGLTTPESLALVENFVPFGGRGHASRLE